MASEKKQDHEKSNIIVNGKKQEWDSETISYSQVVDLVYPPPRSSTEIFTVQYSHGIKNAQGTLVEGQSVQIKSGMVFHVTRTDKS